MREEEYIHRGETALHAWTEAAGVDDTPDESIGQNAVSDMVCALIASGELTEEEVDDFFDNCRRSLQRKHSFSRM